MFWSITFNRNGFDIEKVTFEPFMNSYGDVIKNWATIYLRIKDYE